MTDYAIEFDGVWKKFKRGEDYDSLRDLVPAVARRLFSRNPPIELRAREFWALKDVSFRVQKGEAIGIIGRNGSGKSTTLKLLSGILKPDRGSLTVKGRLGALIEVGAGFHPDLTGRENIYLNGVIGGLKKKQVDDRFDSIVAFSELEEFIDTPVKRYSSGMYARLGFSVAAHLDPDVLLVDEVLSVGDITFQDRCFRRVLEMQRNGTTIVFISHNMEAIAQVCPRVILLDHGVNQMEGDAREVVRAYRHRSHSGEVDGQYAESRITLHSFRSVDQHGVERSVFHRGENFRLQINLEAFGAIPHPVIGLNFFDENDARIFGHNNRMDELDLGILQGRAQVEIEYFGINLQPGWYRVSLDIHEKSGIECYLHRDRAFEFQVQLGGPRYVGIVEWPHVWNTVERLPATEPAAASVDPMSRCQPGPKI